MTFTNKAAREMKERAFQMVGSRALELTISTFHSFGVRVLRENLNKLQKGYSNDFTIVDESDTKKIINDVMKHLRIEKKIITPADAQEYISKYKTEMIKDFSFLYEFEQDMFDIYEGYQEALLKDNLVDFDDLIVYTRDLLLLDSVKYHYRARFNYILVDEFQDTNKIQYEILKLLTNSNKNVFVVGDPDQSIYRFRGAEFRNSNDFIEDFNAKVIILDQNYRSTNSILDAANNVISYNIGSVKDKELRSGRGQGEQVEYHSFYRDVDEVDFIMKEIQNLIRDGYQYKDIAILYRSNFLSSIIESACIEFKIPYIIYGSLRFFERREVKDLLAYLQIIINPDNDFYLKRIINVPTRGIGSKTIEKLEDFAKKNKTSMFEAIDNIELSEAAKKNLNKFKELIETLRLESFSTESVSDLISYIVDEINYFDYLRKDEAADERIKNVGELMNVFASKDDEGQNVREQIKNILDDIALATNSDKKEDDESIIISTIHQVKGLEFKVVFMPMLEEDVFPNNNRIIDLDDMEEERRVFYVGITRAKEKLILSNATTRRTFGRFQYTTSSRFIDETKRKKRV